MNPKILLKREDYEICLKFVLKLRYLWGGRIGDFRSSGIKRDVGKYIHDHIGGKLAEIAFCKFCEREFGVRTKPDFEKYEEREEFAKGDIVALFDEGTWREPRIKIDVKDTKPTSRWELIPSDLSSTHAMDYFVFVIVDLPLNHIVQYFKVGIDFEDEEELLSKIPNFQNIQAEVIGLLSRDDLKSRAFYFEEGTEIPEVEFFKPRKRKPPGELAEILPEADLISLNIGSLGVLEFVFTGRLKLYQGNVERTRERKKVQVFETYIQCVEDVVLENEFLGRYSLEKGFYKIEVRSLSRLRENNYGIPVRVLPSKREKWKEMLSLL
jgi:hypothetical protein